MRILLTGGGTGGHIYPALALYHYLKNNNSHTDFLYVGTSQGLEAQIVPKEQILFKTVTSAGLTRSFSAKNLISLAKVLKGLGESARILRTFKPQVVVGTGGFVCGPVVLMASLMEIPTVIHEQNAFPGITNRLLAPFATKICLTFPETEKYFSKHKNKTTITGLPIRPKILDVSKKEALDRLQLDNNKKTILVVGGSRGARSINNAIYSVIEEFKGNNNIQILIITGQAGHKDFNEGLKTRGLDVQRDNIFVKPYLDQMEYGLGSADLVIARAGATFLAEITALGKPAILIPYPFAAENHQEYNAKAVVKAGGAIMIKDNQLSGELLTAEIKKLLAQPQILNDMGVAAKSIGKPQALEKLAQIVMEAAEKR